MSTIQPIFNPKNPIRGMRSSVSPAALGDGFFAQLTNWRFTKNGCVVRDGLSKKTSAVPVASASFRGAWSGYLNGTQYIVAAYRVGGATTRYYTLDTGTFAWTEISKPAGKYGNTQNNADNYITSFAPMRDWDGTDTLVAFSGPNNPLVFDPSVSSVAPSYQLARVVSSPYTTLDATFTPTSESWVELSCPAYASIYQSGAGRNALCFVNSTANFALADVGTGSDRYCELTIATAAATGDTAYFDFANATAVTWAIQTLDLSASRQLIMCVGGWDDAWSNLKVEIYDSGAAAYTTVYDPTSATSTLVVIPDVDPNDASKVVVAFSLDSVVATSRDAVTRIRFTYSGAASQTTAQKLQIYLIAGGGGVQGGASYGITWINTGARFETPGRILSRNESPLFQNIGGTPSLGLRLPNSPLLYFKPKVHYDPIGSSAAGSYGITSANIYRNDTGEDDYYYIGTDAIYTYTEPAGVPTWGGPAVGTIQTYTDTTLVADKQFNRVMPDEQIIYIPRADVALAANGRLYVGGDEGSISGTSRGAMISDLDYPMRFRERVKFIDPQNPDPNSGTKLLFPGEYVTAFYRGQGAYTTTDPVWVFTNRSVYRLENIDPASLSRPTYQGPHGTVNPGSFADHNGVTYYLDCEKQIRGVGQRGTALSWMKVDDKLSAGTTAASWGACLNNRYFLFYKASGSSTYRDALFYEEPLGEFGADLYTGLDIRGSVEIDTAGVRTVYLFAEAGHVYQLETAGQTTDDGTAIATTITTPEYHSDMWRWMQSDAVGVVTTPVSATLTVSRTWKPLASGQSGTISLTSSNTTTYVWEYRTSDQVHVGGSGLSYQLSITGSLAGGTQVYSIVKKADVLVEESRAESSA